MAKIAKNGYFFVKRARRFRNAEGAQDPFRVLYVLGHPKWENLGLLRARFYKKTTMFLDFRHAMSLRIPSTFDSRAFRRV